MVTTRRDIIPAVQRCSRLCSAWIMSLLVVLVSGTVTKINFILLTISSVKQTVPCIYRMPGGVIVGDSGLCCCGPVVSSLVLQGVVHGVVRPRDWT